MADLKIVLYKGNRTPRSIAVDTHFIYKILAIFTLSSLIFLTCLGLAIHFYFSSRNFQNTSLSSAADTIDLGVGPFNSPEEQNKALKDQLELLSAKLKNKEAILNSNFSIDKTHPALALFEPNVVDHTKHQENVTIKNMRYTPVSSNSTAIFNFEIHNAKEMNPVQKGYIVVIARGSNFLKTYPETIDPKASYLIDFEKGETFQVARFRTVNAQFDLTEDPETIQILLFTRSGELLVNSLYEVPTNGRQ